MSGLRIAGLTFGLLFFIISFLYFRGSRWNRGTFLFSIIFSCLLIIISVFPELINWLADFFLITKDDRGRLIGLLIVSVVVLFLLYIRREEMINQLRLTLDQTIRSTSMRVSQDYNILLSRKSNEIDILVIVPAYNEEENLKQLLPLIPEEIDGYKVSVAVVDDGSNDNTVKVARDHKVFVITNLFNRGQGSASRLGYDLAEILNVKACVTMDADMQHSPADLPAVLAPILHGDYDLVIGSRRLGTAYGSNKVRSLGVNLLSRLSSLLMGQKFTDVSSGFKSFRLSSLCALTFQEDQFQAAEVLITCVKKGLKIKEVPITIDKRMFGETKKGSDWNYGARFLCSLLRAWWRSKNSKRCGI